MFVSNLLLSGLLLLSPSPSDQPLQRVQIRLVTDEADAVLVILGKRSASAPISDSDWHALFESEGYRRLKKREQAMQRPFEDAAFKDFVLSPQLLSRAAPLRQTLVKWKHADMNRPANLALAYLPTDAHIHAAVYPVIKPLTNSFVFEVKTDPAIFLYLDPDIGGEKFENTVAHELHHIGYGTACPSKARAALISQQPERVRTLANWIGAFGEGFAMLAAAGGPAVHPHAASKLEDRERWDADMSDFRKNQQELDRFFRSTLDGTLTQEQAKQQGFTYFGVQGPWYTVGWKIAVTIEKAYGRQRLIEAMCDAPTLLATYNAAVTDGAKPGSELPVVWSQEIIKALAPIAH